MGKGVIGERRDGKGSDNKEGIGKGKRNKGEGGGMKNRIEYCRHSMRSDLVEFSMGGGGILINSNVSNQYT